MAEATGLLLRWRQGDERALNELMPLVYDELRRVARSSLRSHPQNTLQPTALVHEAWVKLLAGSTPSLTDRAHFLALMSKVMRQVLIDHVRAAAAAKRWGGQQRVVWDADLEAPKSASPVVEILDVDRALNALAKTHEPLARIIEMHYFGGMTAEEVATVLDRTPDAVRHDIRLARAHLRRELDRPAIKQP